MLFHIRRRQHAKTTKVSTRKQTHKLGPRIRRNPNPLQPFIRLRQLLNLLPRRAFGVEQRHGIDHGPIVAIARILRGQKPLDARARRGRDQRALLAHRHEAQREEDGILVREGGREEGGVVVGTSLDRDRGRGREGGAGGGAGDEGDVEASGVEEVGEGAAADVTAGLQGMMLRWGRWGAVGLKAGV